MSPPISGCYHPHPPSPFVSPKVDTHFTITRRVEARLSRPRLCRKGAQPVPKAVHRSGSRDKHNWPRPLTPQSIMPSLDHCDLQRHVGVNNLQHRGGRELNSQLSSCKSNALATRLPSHPVVVVVLGLCNRQSTSNLLTFEEFLPRESRI